MTNPAVPYATEAADGSTGRPSGPGEAYVRGEALAPGVTFGASPGSPRKDPFVRRWLPVVLLVVGGVGCLIAVVPLYRQGVADHAFPSYIPGQPAYDVTRYSAPWIAGALALAGLGVIGLAVAVARVVTTRPNRPAAGSGAPVGAVVPAAPSADPDRHVSTTAPVPFEGLEPRPSEAAREF